MRKTILNLFALAIVLLGSMSTYAVDWSKHDFLGDGAGGGTYANKYKVETVANLSVVNIQQPGWGTEAGIYVTLPAAPVSSVSVSSDIQGSGVLLHLSAFTAEETTVNIEYVGGSVSFLVYYADGQKANVLYKVASYASSGTAADGNDGNEGSRWNSASADPQWWVANMGEQRTFNTVQILWEGAYAKSYTIEVSNDSLTWTTIATIEDQTLKNFPNLQTLTVGTQTAQYFRFNGIARGTGYGYSFWEIKAFVKKAQSLTTLELSAAAKIVKEGEKVKLTTATKDQDGEAMDYDVTFDVTPAGMGSVVDGNFVAGSTIGMATITATAGELTKTVDIFVYKGENVALSTNIDTDNKVIAQSNTDYTQGANSAFYAVDESENSIYQGCVTNGTTDTDSARTYNVWFVLDLGQEYDLNLISIKFEGACSQLYHVDVASTYAAEETAWKEAYNYVGTNGTNGHTDYIYGDNLQNAQKVRYVRFFSTKAATVYGMKIYDMKVFGVASSTTPTGVVETASPAKEVKVIENGQLVIIRDGIRYNVLGATL